MVAEHPQLVEGEVDDAGRQPRADDGSQKVEMARQGQEKGELEGPAKHSRARKGEQGAKHTPRIP